MQVFKILKNWFYWLLLFKFKIRLISIVIISGHELNPSRVYVAQLWCPSLNADEPRYSLAIVDSSEQDLLPQDLNGKYGIFIVPQGETIVMNIAIEHYAPILKAKRLLHS